MTNTSHEDLSTFVTITLNSAEWDVLQTCFRRASDVLQTKL